MPTRRPCMHRIVLSTRWAIPIASITLVLLIAVLLAVLPGIGFTDAPGKWWTERDPQAPPMTAQTPAWVEIAKAVKPAVVNITTKVTAEPAGRMPRGMPEEFREFFKRFGPRRTA